MIHGETWSLLETWLRSTLTIVALMVYMWAWVGPGWAMFKRK